MEMNGFVRTDHFFLWLLLVADDDAAVDVVDKLVLSGNLILFLCL